MIFSTSDSGVLVLLVLDGGCCGTAHCESSGGCAPRARLGRSSASRAGRAVGACCSGGVRVRDGCTTAAALAGRDILAAVVGPRITTISCECAERPVVGASDEQVEPSSSATRFSTF